VVEKVSVNQQLESDLTEAIKTLAAATKDVKNISEAKSQLVLGHQEIKGLVEGLKKTVEALEQTQQSLSSVEKNSKESLKTFNQMSKDLLTENQKYWLRTMIALGILGVVLVFVMTQV
jgi:uncharacterized phage infection (PIP) family protein YhgE